MGEGLGVTLLDLWQAEFHAGKELRAKLVGLPGSAVEFACPQALLRRLRIQLHSSPGLTLKTNHGTMVPWYHG